jgi:hypothetical protein
LLWLVVSGVQAQYKPVRGAALNWVRLPGAETCIAAAELARHVEMRLERSIFVTAPYAEISFDGYIEPQPTGGFVAHLTVTDSAGKRLGLRELQSAAADCHVLDDALVLVTALTLFPKRFGLGSGIALDPETSARLQALFGDEPTVLDPSELPANAGPFAAAHGSAARTPALAPPAVARPEREPRNSQAATLPWRLSLEVAPVAAFGVVPGVGLGGGAVFGVRPTALWPLQLGFAHFFTTDARATALHSGVGHFDRDELMLLGCPVTPRNRAGFELCAGAIGGLLHFQANGFASANRRASDYVFDVGAQAGLRVLLLHVVLARLSAGAFLPLLQHAYAFQGLDGSTQRLFRTTQVAGRVLLGVGVEF